VSLFCSRVVWGQLKGRIFLPVWKGQGHRDSFLSVTVINTSVGHQRKYPNYLWQTTIKEGKDQEKKKAGQSNFDNSVSHNWNHILWSYPTDFLPHASSAVNGKAIPLQAWTGTWVSRKLRFPDFKTISPTHRPPLPPRKYTWYSFLLEAESTLGPQWGRKDYVTEKFHRESNPRPSGW
jgi:hypothetical protein